MIRFDFDIRNLRNLRIVSATSAANPANGTFVSLFINDRAHFALILGLSGLQTVSSTGSFVFLIRDPSANDVALSQIFSPNAIDAAPAGTFCAQMIVVPPLWEIGFVVVNAPGVGNTMTMRAYILELMISGESRDLERAGAGG